MRSKLVVIAGGSGAGKSTAAIGLCRRYPKDVALVHLDDYYKEPVEAPRLPDGSVNWDSPNALRFDDLTRELRGLLDGGAVTVLTKSELYNPGYRAKLRNYVRQRLEPRPIIILEGHLTLFDQRIRTLADACIFLEMPIEESVLRRSCNKFTPPAGYFELVLFPAHLRYVEATRCYAHAVIDVATLTDGEVLSRIEDVLRERGILPKSLQPDEAAIT